MKTLTDFCKTVETGVDPRLAITMVTFTKNKDTPSKDWDFVKLQ